MLLCNVGFNKLRAKSHVRWTVLRTWYKCLYWCWYYLNAESLWSCKSVCKYYFLFVAVVHDFRKRDRIKYICIYILIQMTCLLGRESLDMSVCTVCILCTVCDEHVFFFFFFRMAACFIAWCVTFFFLVQCLGVANLMCNTLNHCCPTFGLVKARHLG